MPRAKQRTPELRDYLLSVAVGVLAAEGAAGFTTRRIAAEAQTSTPAVYELFGDKGGLIREVFFEGFRRLRAHLEQLVDTGDPYADLVALVWLYRDFIIENPVLCEVMFSRPFTDFEPEPFEREAGSSVRVFIVEHVRRCTNAGLLDGDPTDIAHILVALVQGLAFAENVGRLGTTIESVDRRWALAVRAVLEGLSR